MTFKVIIAGGRDFDKYDLLQAKVDQLLANKNKVEIVSGKSSGADKLGEDYATEKGYSIKEFPADWDNIDVEGAVVKYTSSGKPYNAIAGHMRNQNMSDYADALILFWDGKSKGSYDMLKRARKRGLEIRIIRYE